MAKNNMGIADKISGIFYWRITKVKPVDLFSVTLSPKIYASAILYCIFCSKCVPYLLGRDNIIRIFIKYCCYRACCTQHIDDNSNFLVKIRFVYMLICWESVYVYFH